MNGSLTFILFCFLQFAVFAQTKMVYSALENNDNDPTVDIINRAFVSKGFKDIPDLSAIADNLINYTENVNFIIWPRISGELDHLRNLSINIYRKEDLANGNFNNSISPLYFSVKYDTEFQIDLWLVHVIGEIRDFQSSAKLQFGKKAIHLKIKCSSDDMDKLGFDSETELKTELVDLLKADKDTQTLYVSYLEKLEHIPSDSRDYISNIFAKKDESDDISLVVALKKRGKPSVRIRPDFTCSSNNFDSFQTEYKDRVCQKLRLENLIP